MRPLALLVALLVAACAHRPQPVRWEARAGVEVARIAKAASPLQGAACFSPAGDRLAYLHDGLHVVDLDTGRRRAVPNTVWTRVVAWSGGELLLAGPGPRVVRIDEQGEERQLLSQDAATLPDRLFVHRGDLLLVGHAVRDYTFGREVVWSVARLRPDGGRSAPLFEASAVYLPGQTPAGGSAALDPLGASPALSPQGEFALLLRHLPPAAPAYAELLTAPPGGGPIEPTRRAKWRATVCGADWSADGRLAVIAGGAIYLFDGEHVDGRRLGPAVCAPPAWSPAGDRIFVGGRLIPVEGGTPEELFPPDPATTATWSADGRLLAVARPDGLWLVRFKGGPPPTAIAARRRLLDRLHRDGVIDDATYRERLRRLPPALPPPSP